VRFTLDSNILAYSLAEETGRKRDIARDILLRARTADSVLAAQAVGEFLNVVRRKYPQYFEAAIDQARLWARLFPIAETSTDHVLDGADFARRHRLQLWDSILWQVARSAGAEIFVSEDLQDGLSIGGMTVIDPFDPANAEKLARLLEPRP
jgi:predicted nucleic acid-binding protein